jgi:hypothetical protein
VDLADEAERLGNGQPIEQREIFGDDADAALDLDGRGRGIEAEDPDVARRGLQQARQALDRRRLACAVGTEEAVEAARRHAEIDAVNRALRSECARQPVRLDCEFHAEELYVSMSG